MKTFKVFFLCLIVSAAVWAQEPFQAGGGFILGLPQTEFKENVDNPGGGFGGYFGVRLGDSPFLLGAGVNFLLYGSETREEPFSQTIPDVKVDVTTNNSILQGYLMCRIQPPGGLRNSVVSPYLEGLFGFNYLFTETRIDDHDWDDDYDDDIAGSKNYDDSAMSYGGGGGLMFRLWENPDSDAQPAAVYLDLGVRYIFGGEAKYLKEGDIHRTKTKVSYTPSESTTDLLTVRLGVSVTFNAQ